MDKIMKTITRERHLKLLPLTYGHGQSHEKYNKSKTPKTLVIDIWTLTKSCKLIFHLLGPQDLFENDNEKIFDFRQA